MEIQITMALVLSKTASNGTTPQQKDQLPNPFELQDSQIRHKVYLTHVNDEKEFDRDVLFTLVSNTLNSASAQLSAAASSVTSFKPDFPTLKWLSCQMITTRGTPECAHQTALRILQQLSGFSWDAKALVAVAAFSLEYGEFLRLDRVQAADQFGNSLKQLNQVQISRRVPADMTDLVTVIGEVLNYINLWAKWSAMDYDIEAVHSLQAAMQEIPLVVYWTIASTVASIGNLVGISEHKLSAYKERLEFIFKKLQFHLENCRVEIGRIQDYCFRNTIRYPKLKDVVELLDILIIPGSDNGTSIPKIFEGGVLIKNGIEVFKQKYVMLFFSSLDNIGDEISLLNSINNGLQENPGEEIKGDFKILWIPIVDAWDVQAKTQDTIKWYAVEFFTELPGTDLIKEKFNYLGKPIIPVLTPLGDIMNEDAMNLIFQWGIEAFPFRKIDGIELTLKWKWFWDATKKANLGIQQVTGDRYIFISRVQDFTVAVEKTKGHATILNTDTIIDHYQLGKEDPTDVRRFWIEIERNRLKKHKDAVDCEIRKIVKTLLCLKQDQQGWAILTKGSNVRVLGHGEPMRQTLAEFDTWKEKVFQKEGFDVAFDEYYKTKLDELYARQECDFVKNNADVLVTIACPNPTCGRVMEVTSVNYKCCHRDATNNIKVY
ncbi:Protein SIEVE ELEMENT OCCLUSION B [Glycine soja]